MPRSVSPASRDTSDLLPDGQSAIVVAQAGLAGDRAEVAPAAATWVPRDVPTETAVWREADYVEVEYETDVEDESESGALSS